MKQKLKRFMAGFMAMLTLVGTLFTNGTTAFAASPQANIAFWNASVKNSFGVFNFGIRLVRVVHRTYSCIHDERRAYQYVFI